jgi:hypothetical protein
MSILLFPGTFRAVSSWLDVIVLRLACILCLSFKFKWCVITREESVSSVDTVHATKKRKRQKVSREVASSESTDNAGSNTNQCVNEEASKMTNAEKAARRITGAHGKPERDTSRDNRTVFVGNVSLTVGKKVVVQARFY